MGGGGGGGSGGVGLFVAPEGKDNSFSSSYQ